MKTRRIRDIEIEQIRDPLCWSDYIGSFPACNVFNTAVWVECFASARLDPLYLRLSRHGSPIGGIAGIGMRPQGRLMSLLDRPLYFWSGPTLADDGDSETVAQCMLALGDYARAAGFTGVVNQGIDYPLRYDWCGERFHPVVQYDYIVDLRPPWSAIQAGMRRSICEQARKASRSGVTYRESSDSLLYLDLLQLMAVSKARKSQSEQDYLFYYLPYLSESAVARLSATEASRFFVAQLGDEIVCLLQAFVCNKRAYALWLGASEDGYRSRAIAFLWLHAIESLKSSGVEWLNLSGAWEGSSLAFAKLSLGAQRTACSGSVSAFLQGPLRYLASQVYKGAKGLLRAERNRRTKAPRPAASPQGWAPSASGPAI